MIVPFLVIAAAPSLGRAESFSLLAGSGVTASGPMRVTGNVGAGTGGVTGVSPAVGSIKSVSSAWNELAALGLRANDSVVIRHARVERIADRFEAEPSSPPGVTVDPSGVLSLTATKQVTYDVTVFATDTYGCSGTHCETETVGRPTIRLRSRSIARSGCTCFRRADARQGWVTCHQILTAIGQMPSNNCLRYAQIYV